MAVLPGTSLLLRVDDSLGFPNTAEVIGCIEREVVGSANQHPSRVKLDFEIAFSSLPDITGSDVTFAVAFTR
jgi:hypothetical protein